MKDRDLFLQLFLHKVDKEKYKDEISQEVKQLVEKLDTTVHSKLKDNPNYLVDKKFPEFKGMSEEQINNILLGKSKPSLLERLTFPFKSFFNQGIPAIAMVASLIFLIFLFTMNGVNKALLKLEKYSGNSFVKSLSSNGEKNTIREEFIFNVGVVELLFIGMFSFLFFKSAKLRPIFLWITLIAVRLFVSFQEFFWTIGADVPFFLINMFPQYDSPIFIYLLSDLSITLFCFGILSQIMIQSKQQRINWFQVMFYSGLAILALTISKFLFFATKISDYNGQDKIAFLPFLHDAHQYFMFVVVFLPFLIYFIVRTFIGRKV